ncbi:unnamed protein product [Plutella xylostella]|uniref:(diamondback moth) hypothetical protein n=1 Tax=Plutella xylostella TaxID=51655 RepID=A0A8S4G3Y0_PLUXY|nr:unnamed protein product [Plutella xylostella]
MGVTFSRRGWTGGASLVPGAALRGREGRGRGGAGSLGRHTRRSAGRPAPPAPPAPAPAARASAPPRLRLNDCKPSAVVNHLHIKVSLNIDIGELRVEDNIHVSEQRVGAFHFCVSSRGEQAVRLRG